MSDCALLPSRFQGESFPLSLIQAMQAGTPIVATRIGEIPAMTTMGKRSAGPLIAPLDDDHAFTAALGDAMVRMLDDKFRRRRAADAKAIAARCSMAKMADSYGALFARLIAAADRSGARRPGPRIGRVRPSACLRSANLRTSRIYGRDGSTERKCSVRLVLHIGGEKTGTTALQDFLFRNSRAIHANEGILYPAAGPLCFNAAHFPVLTAFLPAGSLEFVPADKNLTPDGLQRELLAISETFKPRI
jgi:hypothetical protein